MISFANATIKNNLLLVPRYVGNNDFHRHAGITLALLFSVLFVSQTAAADTDLQAQCSPESAVRTAQVSYVHDGDSIGLKSGEKVRIIGINTPEIADKRRLVNEPLSMDARNLLRSKISGRMIYLEFDEERKDRYGRSLAHVHLPNGVNVAAWMLEQGVAYAVTIPPNLRHRDCYRLAQQRARDAQRGIWHHQYYSPVAAANVRKSGFARVHGCVRKVVEKSGGLDLILTNQLLLRIRAASIEKPYFKAWLSSLERPILQACMTVGGWVYNERNTKRRILEIKHPDAVETIHFN